MFVGEHLHSVDAKGRVVLPSRFRDKFKVADDVDAPRRCVVAKGPDGNLVVYPMAVWEQEAEKMISRRPTARNRRIQREFFSGADEQALDKQGRLLLRPDLRRHARLETSKEALVVGMFNRLELWNPEVYEAGRDERERDFQADQGGEDDDDM